MSKNYTTRLKNCKYKFPSLKNNSEKYFHFKVIYMKLTAHLIHVYKLPSFSGRMHLKKIYAMAESALRKSEHYDLLIRIDKMQRQHSEFIFARYPVRRPPGVQIPWLIRSQLPSFSSGEFCNTPSNMLILSTYKSPIIFFSPNQLSRSTVVQHRCQLLVSITS
jgi:hypothetical protein